jgi:hypothetical protein
MLKKAAILGLALASFSAFIFESSQSALAQSAVQNCVRELVEVGVTPDAAASQCIQGGGVVIIKGQPAQNGSPAAIASCMDSLLYRTEERKPFPGWICVPNDVNCKTVRVRTEMSEATAIQACQNAR